MKALRLYGHEDIRYEEAEEPRPPAGWSLIEVCWTSICKSDIKEYHGPLYISGKVNPITGVSLPVTLGHEFMGRVVEMNGPHPTVNVGDRVAVDGCIWCGECWYCLHGRYVLCDKLAILGFDAHGSFAPLIVAPNYSIFKLPDSVSDEAGALIEPLAVAMHGALRGRTAAGDVVAIVGAGMIGVGTLAMALAAGVSEAYVIEPIEERRKRALALGATAVIDPTKEDPVKCLNEVTHGHLADVVFDCVGFQSTVPTSINLTRKAGRLVLVGVPTAELTVDLMNVVVFEKEIYGSLCYQDDFPRAIALVADGRLNTEPFITGRIALRDIIEKGFGPLTNEPEKHIRIVIDAQAT